MKNMRYAAVCALMIIFLNGCACCWNGQCGLDSPYEPAPTQSLQAPEEGLSTAPVSTGTPTRVAEQ